MSSPAPPRLPTVTVVGLGPGRAGLVTTEALAAVAAIPVRWLRTARHPSAGLVPGARSFDGLYESAGDLEEVYRGIVEALVSSARTEGAVLYAVPGSPVVAERSVELLRADGRARTVVLPALSFADLAFSCLGIDPLAEGVALVDGHRFSVEAAGRRGPMLVGQCDSPAVLSGLKLAIGAVVDQLALPGTPTVTVLQRLGLDDEAVTELAWYDLDRAVVPDHLTCVWVPALGLEIAAEVTRLEELGRALRQRCPWDREQTHRSLTRYVVEEAYEVVDAVDELGPDGAGYDHLEEELGDVLFQVVFHSLLAAEEGQFGLADVARTAHDKLVGRHPHVFGGAHAATADDVRGNWESYKRREKGKAAAGVMAGLPRDLPGLLLADKVQGRAASVGFDWDRPEGAMAKVTEELEELRQAAAGERAHEELGDLLFSVVNVARHLRLDPEVALRDAVAKFRRRFEMVEALAAERGQQLPELRLEELDALWEEVKAGRRGGPG